MLEATILPYSVFTRSDRLRPNTKFIRLSGSEYDKTIVDDFAMTGYCKLVSNLALRAAEVRLVIRFVTCGKQFLAPPQTKTTPKNKSNYAPTYGRYRAKYTSGPTVGVVQKPLETRTDSLSPE